MLQPAAIIVLNKTVCTRFFPLLFCHLKGNPRGKLLQYTAVSKKMFFFKSVSDNAERWFNMDNGESLLLNWCVIQIEESMNICIHAFSFLLKHYEPQPSHAKITYHLPLCLLHNCIGFCKTTFAKTVVRNLSAQGPETFSSLQCQCSVQWKSSSKG